MSDRGAVFQSQIVTELLRLMGTTSTFTTSYKPSTNGLSERLNKTIADMLCKYTSTSQSDWDTCLPHVIFAYNTATQGSTLYSPFEIVYGREVRLPTDAQLSLVPGTEYAMKSKERIELIREEAARNIRLSRDKDKNRYDQKHREVSYNIGDRVKVRTPLRQVGKTDKLQPKYFGPYRIIDKRNDFNDVIQAIGGRNPKTDVVHVSRLAPYYDQLIIT